MTGKDTIRIYYKNKPTPFAKVNEQIDQARANGSLAVRYIAERDGEYLIYTGRDGVWCEGFDPRAMGEQPITMRAIDLFDTSAKRYKSKRAAVSSVRRAYEALPDPSRVACRGNRIYIF